MTVTEQDWLNQYIPRHVFVDLDGVLADFDTGYERVAGVRPSIADDNVDWTIVARAPSFYADLPRMSDAADLIDGVRALGVDPVVLTGVPSAVPSAARDKVKWVNTHFPGLEVIACKSKHKAKAGRPGDVLIDDWPKYRDRWVAMGGIWITHTSAAQSLAELRAVLGAPCDG